MTKERDSKTAMSIVRGRYTLLLVTLLAVTALYPFAGDHGVVTVLLYFATLGVIVAALVECSNRRHAFTIAILFGVGTLVSRALSELGVPSAGLFDSGLRFVFLALVTGMIFADVLRSRRVTMNTVFGACAVYILMAFTWASVFGLVEGLQPGSFDLTSVTANGPPRLLRIEAELNYFSMITLTTVGYGDVSPVSSQARSLAALEGILGQLYLAIIIARLVGLELAHRGGEPDS